LNFNVPVLNSNLLFETTVYLSERSPHAGHV
jgi:hypothetical protein